MSFDGIITKGITSELNKSILNGKVNKVYQPSKNEILLGIYSNNINYMLDLVIEPKLYRINLTKYSKPNPFNAYSFCMLLRKHLIGARINKIINNKLERIITFELECYNELNDKINKKLVVELMGKHSNIILINENNRIIDSLRHLDTYSNSYRNILPSYEYELPPCNKYNFLKLNDSLSFYKILKSSEDSSILDAICSKFNGISKLSVEKAIDNLSLSSTISKYNSDKIYNYFHNLLKNIELRKYFYYLL